MKITKKLIAFALATLLIFATGITAFAATPKVVLTPGTLNNGTVTMTLDFVNCEGLKAFDFSLSGDAKFSLVKDGEDLANAADADNALSYEKNPSNGCIGGYFKNELYTTSKWKQAAKDNCCDEAVPDGSNFHAFKIIYKDLSSKKTIKVTLKGTMDTKNGTVQVNQTVVLVKAEESTTKKQTETTTKKTEESTTKKVSEPTTKKAVESTTKKVAETTTKKAVESTTKKTD